ncbi:DNA replication/repair protein RecF [Aestuariirhabdus sp. Z084]|uniref:DNA replication/repair protein RecF n=1 Tax=Aestuariirhabdus haliotis TaxID=2918751 RepID=UPI00201B3CCD|nr:DNA replication/repair protein RecF [Aestuariirhabdus haliotis]MCL6414240.1 DNA replication/repair protein RecF [Aestuariirhabdus haliotis]MCL6418172.1 DNA replication/repair protein RecF [Aestuariirhabdus haliotis]
MPLSRIRVNQLRNLQEAQLSPSPRVNIITGQNGSGKTSVLEAIHLLGLARSFRSTKLKPIIRNGERDCVVFGELTQNQSIHRLGVKRSIDGSGELRIDGAPQRAASSLAELLPLQLITPDSFMLLTGGPKPRRQFIDWGVFHVEHRFISLWKHFQGALKQRNHLLRYGKIDSSVLSVWDAELCKNAPLLDEMRQAYFKQLAPLFREIAQRFDLGVDEQELTLLYHRGWDSKASYEEVLEKNYERDLKSGYTHMGPHRSDLYIRVGRSNAIDRLSRGQQKVLVCALKLAQARLFQQLMERATVFLVDDLAAELDKHHRQVLCDELAKLDCQVFVTCIEQSSLAGMWPDDARIKVFHVEHGNISESNQHKTGSQQES